MKIGETESSRRQVRRRTVDSQAKLLPTNFRRFRGNVASLLFTGSGPFQLSIYGFLLPVFVSRRRAARDDNKALKTSLDASLFSFASSFDWLGEPACATSGLLCIGDVSAASDCKGWKRRLPAFRLCPDGRNQKSGESKYNLLSEFHLDHLLPAVQREQSWKSLNKQNGDDNSVCRWPRSFVQNKPSPSDDEKLLGTINGNCNFAIYKFIVSDGVLKRKSL